MGLYKMNEIVRWRDGVGEVGGVCTSRLNTTESCITTDSSIPTCGPNSVS